MFRTLAVIVLFLIAGISQAGNVVMVDKDCITLQDIFPSLSINDDIFCGLDYGQEKTINKQMSMFIINKYGIKGAQSGEVTFKRRGVLLTEARLKADIKNQLSIMYPDIEVQIDTVRMGRDFYVPENMQYTMDIPQNRFGNISVALDNGVKKYSYSVSITAFKNVYVSSVPIKKGESLVGKVSLLRTDLSRLHGDAVTDVNGYVARVGISAGRPIVSGVVEKRPDALKDTQVTIIYSSNGVEINATGKLVEDAIVGENVRVQNTASGTVLRGIYKGNRVVAVNSAQ